MKQRMYIAKDPVAFKRITETLRTLHSQIRQLRRNGTIL